MPTEYQVRLDAFEGPLDLLLFLIRRAEVEITDIPIATIADQYLDYLKNIDQIDVDRAGEFLVLAATLTEIKARMLAPAARSSSDEGEGGEGEGSRGGRDKAPIDPRADLVRQLIEYKQYRDAAEALDHRRAEWEARYPAAAAAKPAPPPEGAAESNEDAPVVDMEDVHLADLLEAFSRILTTIDLTRVGEHHVVVDDTPLEMHAEDILDRLQRESPPEVAADHPGLPLRAIFTGRTRAEAIGLFLAMLELVRQRKVQIRQDAVLGEIYLRARGGEEFTTENTQSTEPS